MSEQVLSQSQPLPVPLSPVSGSRNLLMSLRKSWLEAVDAIEREIGVSPTTAEIRQMYRAGRLKCVDDKVNRP
jgi:hypothetical protein